MCAKEKWSVFKPPLGWWKQRDLTLSDLLSCIAFSQLREHAYQEFKFDHDVYVGDVCIGEAASYEEIGPSGSDGESPLRVAYLSIQKTNPVYCRIHSQYTVKPKP